jgi:hypothetical protein
MEIAQALLQLCYAMLIFAGYLLFAVFVAPFSYGIASLIFAWNSFRGRNYLSATIAVFTGILFEALGLGIWIALASWIFGSPDQFR